MPEYVVLSLSLILLCVLLIIRLRLTLPPFRVLALLFLIMLPMMLVFDSYLTFLPIVVYNNNLIAGIKIGTIPIEDVSYLIAVIILLPALFEYYKHEEE